MQYKRTEKPFVKNQLKKFDYISVRERTGLEILRNLGINDAFLVNDPVFLLDKEKWLHLLNHSRKFFLVAVEENNLPESTFFTLSSVLILSNMAHT